MNYGYFVLVLYCTLLFEFPNHSSCDNQLCMGYRVLNLITTDNIYSGGLADIQLFSFLRVVGAMLTDFTCYIIIKLMVAISLDWHFEIKSNQVLQL